jgi:hypothetical protein
MRVAIFSRVAAAKNGVVQLDESFHLTVPNWLDLIHSSLSGK